MKRFLLIFLVSSVGFQSLGFAWNSDACNKYARERNKSLPASPSSHGSILISLTCFEPWHTQYGNAGGILSLKMMANTAANQALTVDEKLDWSLRKKIDFLPDVCAEMKHGAYWFADTVSFGFYDALGKFIVNVPIDRSDCY